MLESLTPPLALSPPVVVKNTNKCPAELSPPVKVNLGFQLDIHRKRDSQVRTFLHQTTLWASLRGHLLQIDAGGSSHLRAVSTQVGKRVGREPWTKPLRSIPALVHVLTSCNGGLY